MWESDNSQQDSIPNKEEAVEVPESIADQEEAHDAELDQLEEEAKTPITPTNLNGRTFILRNRYNAANLNGKWVSYKG